MFIKKESKSGWIELVRPFLNAVSFVLVSFLFGLHGVAAQTPPVAAELSSVATRTSPIPTDLQFEFPVILNPGDEQTYNLWAELKALGPTTGKTLLITISGVTYDHRYFEFPSGPSFVKAAEDKGYAVLNIDRLSTGYSGRPPAASLNLAQDVFALHQVVQSVSNGSLSKFGFSRIILVGHSYGSAVAISYAAQYKDVAAIVLTGVSHVPGAGIKTFVADIVPAEQDPVTGPQDYPSGYLTVKAGSIEMLFYNPPTAIPSVVATNESVKGVFSPNPSGAIANFFGSSAGRLGEQEVTVPVLELFGASDILFADNGVAATASLRNTEPKFYPQSPRVEVYAVPATGHALALSATFPVTDAIIFEWLGSL